MSAEAMEFQKPSTVDRLFNRLIGSLLRIGVGFGHMYLLEVRGRKSGAAYTMPVDLLEHGGKRYLVAPRGRTQWVRNAEVAGSVRLRKGTYVTDYRLRPLAEAERPEILKAYLDRFQREVQRFFPVRAGSPVEAFAPLAPRYPAFELLASER